MDEEGSACARTHGSPLKTKATVSPHRTHCPSRIRNTVQPRIKGENRKKLNSPANALPCDQMTRRKVS